MSEITNHVAATDGSVCSHTELVSDATILTKQLLQCEHAVSNRYFIAAVTCRCSIQRVARRSGVLPANRIAMLDETGLDWTCADTLT